MAVQTIFRRTPAGLMHDNATADAIVTFSCMLTVPAGAPITPATRFPTSVASSHHRSSHARTPRIAQVCAYSASDAAARAGIAPRELLIM